jgi:hypothetical protein
VVQALETCRVGGGEQSSGALRFQFSIINILCISQKVEEDTQRVFIHTHGVRNVMCATTHLFPSPLPRSEIQRLAHGVALQVAFERQTLKPVFSLDRL